MNLGKKLVDVMGCLFSNVLEIVVSFPQACVALVKSKNDPLLPGKQIL